MNKARLIRLVLWLAGGAAALWLGVRFVLPLILPFLVGLIAARLTLGPVRFLRDRGRLPGWLASAVVIFGLCALLGLGLFWLCRIICAELLNLTRALPALLQSLSEPADRLRDGLERLIDCAPALLRQTLLESVESLFSSGRVLVEKGSAWLFSLASGAVAALPDLLLFLVAAVASGVMLSSRYDALGALAREKLPAPFLKRFGQVAAGLRGTFSVWLKAELKLLGLTFLLVTAGLALLGTGYPLLFGGVIALIDALPVFGSGIILAPWAALCFVQGMNGRGMGLLALWAVAWLTHTTLEPRLVGKQAGLDPLLTLLALYAGYKLMGVLGMLLFPAGAVLAKQLWDNAEGLRRGQDA